MNDATGHSEAILPSADCDQPDGRVRRRRQDRLGRLAPIEFETIMTDEALQTA